MITFKTFLAEIFDNPFNWKKVKQTNSETVYKFGHDDDYRVDVNVYDKDQVKQISVVRFSHQNSFHARMARNNDPFKVYATVKDITKDHITNNMKQGNSLVFMAIEDKTIPIYRKIIQNLASETNSVVTRADEHGFILKKK